MVCATFGELGRRGEYATLSRSEFAAMRRRELEASCAALGVRPPHFLGCADQGLARDCVETATSEVARYIQALRPDVVLTFGPDGVSGHADHVAISGIATTAFSGSVASMGASAAGEAISRPTTLYYVLRSAAVPACCRAREDAPPPPPATTTIDVGTFGERKLAAVRCHRSQRHLQPLTPDRESVIVTSHEVFHRAVPAWAGGARESALFGIADAPIAAVS